ncbi:MAG TPA: restriction endonuclease, partial [Verrucomicrobiota bacterium]|nr:restriction endonuclease [Verrucomicrobiota bacterium]HNU52004.1 restriction endonuclease [Verrucomicrobiota bacterium]
GFLSGSNRNPCPISSECASKDILGLIGLIAGLIILANVASPESKAILHAVLSVLFVLALLGAAAALLYWVFKPRRRNPEPVHPRLPCSVMSLDAASIDAVLHASVAPAQNSGVAPANRSSSAINLRQALHEIAWFMFEKLLALAWQKVGYEVVREGGARADGGMDLRITRGGETLAVQCKHWSFQKVGVPQVRNFVGALTIAGLESGIIMTLRGAHDEARELAAKQGITIQTEADVVALLEQAWADFDPTFHLILLDRRKFCPRCEREMVRRTARPGRGTGEEFWGCSGYPRCRYTMPILQSERGCF